MTKLSQLKIDPEFQNQINPPSFEETHQLEIPENTDDYYGKDGLLHCGKCHTPKEAFFAKGIALMGKNKNPIECICQRT